MIASNKKITERALVKLFTSQVLAYKARIF